MLVYPRCRQINAIDKAAALNPNASSEMMTAAQV
jgi:hypothetical protein